MGGLLNCVSIVSDPHLPTEERKCFCDKRTRGWTNDKRHDFGKHARIDHEKERTGNLSWYSDDQLWQLMEISNTWYCRDALVQFLRGAIMSENQTMCSGEDSVWSEVLD